MAVFAVLVATFVFSIGSIVAEYRSESAGNRRRRRMVVGANVAVTICALVAGGLELWGQSQDARTAAEHATQRAAYEARIETLQTQTRDLVTGGKSYVWVYAQKYPFTHADKNLFLISAVHGGDVVPAFDVTIEFETTGQCDGVLSTNPGRGPRELRRIYFPAITSHLAVYPIQTFLNPTCDDAFYLATIHTRNRLLSQQTLLKNEGSDWIILSRVVDVESGDLVYAYPTLDAVNQQKWATEFPSQKHLRRMRESFRSGEVVNPPGEL